MPRAAVVVLSTALALAALPALPGGANAAEPGYGEALDILPPGQSGTVTAADAAKVATGDPQGRVAIDGKNAPSNFAIQLEMYDALNTVAPGSLKEGDLTKFYKPAPLRRAGRPGAAPGDPRRGVHITWDTFGVPHIKGDTREDVAFGAGYAGTHDRMFLQDVLRHTGEARAADSFGPTDDNVKMDQEQLRSAFYTHDEAAAQGSPRCPAGCGAEVAPGWSPPSTRSSPGSTPARTPCARSARRSARSARRSTQPSARSPSRGTAPTWCT